MRGSQDNPGGDPPLACAAFTVLAYLAQDLDVVPRSELVALHKITNGAAACVGNPCHQTPDFDVWTQYKDALISRSVGSRSC